jgi:hypothetical protein
MATTSIGAPGVVFPDGSTQASASPGLPIVRIYTSPSPWTKPATLKAIKVTVVGGGGAGGGRPAGTAGAGAGGGGGAVAFGFFQAPAIPGPVTITVGATATGTLGAVAGNPSSFGALVSCTGGGAGGAGIVPNGTGAGGAGGTMTPSPQVYGLNGATGGSPTVPTTPAAGLRTAASPFATGSFGGPSGFGFGIGGANSTSILAGQPGFGYGAGGSGQNTGPFTPGGNGTEGIVIVEEFY